MNAMLNSTIYKRDDIKTTEYKNRLHKIIDLLYKISVKWDFGSKIPVNSECPFCIEAEARIKEMHEEFRIKHGLDKLSVMCMYPVPKCKICLIPDEICNINPNKSLFRDIQDAYSGVNLWKTPVGSIDKTWIHKMRELICKHIRLLRDKGYERIDTKLAFDGFCTEEKKDESN